MAVSAPLRVLVVDDSDAERRVVERFFTKLSCSVTCLRSAVEATRFLGLDGSNVSEDSKALGFHLVVTDYCMPGMTGEELLRKIKESSMRDTPVVVMSSDNISSRISSCLSTGAMDFLLKPVQWEDAKRISRTASTCSSEVLSTSADNSTSPSVQLDGMSTVHRMGSTVHRKKPLVASTSTATSTETPRINSTPCDRLYGPPRFQGLEPTCSNYLGDEQAPPLQYTPEVSRELYLSVQGAARASCTEGSVAQASGPFGVGALSEKYDRLAGCVSEADGAIVQVVVAHNSWSASSSACRRSSSNTGLVREEQIVMDRREKQGEGSLRGDNLVSVATADQESDAARKGQVKRRRESNQANEGVLKDLLHKRRFFIFP